MTELGVVIPTLNEARHLPGLLHDLAELDPSLEVVVADGGSLDGTPELARAMGARLVHAPPSRAAQLNAGAAVLHSPWLAFFHADCRLGPEARDALRRWLPTADPRTAAVFRFRLDGHRWFWRVLEAGQRMRQRLTGLPYGDQGLVISRGLFNAVGGYPELPVMEDVEILRRLRRHGRLLALPAPLLTSPRRYEREGRLRGWLRNAVLVSLHLAGIDARRLARWYHREPAPGRTLLLFVKAPDPGYVKTRLAADLGATAATELYRSLAKRVFDQVRNGPYQLAICYEPPHSETRVRNWLGDPDGVHFERQANGDLGQRLLTAFDRAFRRGARTVCAIGGDAPDVDHHVASRAFDALTSHDVVFGPARDGGYYLIGLAHPQPQLFQDVPWSTDRVLEVSRRKAATLGLRVAELATLSDVDTVRDLPGFLPPLSHP